MNTYYLINNELSHYGVKGMKWGVRHDERYASAKDAKRTANKEYDKAFNKAYKFSQRHPVTQHIKKSKNYKKSNDLWGDARSKAIKANEADKNLKDTKKIIKNERYRDRLAKRASNKSGYYKLQSANARKDLDDLNKNGRNSRAYKQAANAKYYSNKWNYERTHGSGSYGGWDAWADAVHFEANSKTTIKELRSQLESSSNSYAYKAKKWTSRSKKVMNTPITSTTTRKDIRDIYKGK